MFQTIKKSAKSCGIAEYRLRQWHKQGLLPGFAAGNRWYVDVDRLRAQLEQISEAAAKIGTEKEANRK